MPPLRFIDSTSHPQDYNRLRKVWNGTIHLYPKYIVQCENEQDIVNALDFAKTHELEIAVRGGGHSVSGFSASDGGLLIDLSLMKSVIVNSELKTVTVGGGALWGHVDEACDPYQMFVPGGMVSHTGVGGLTLGGGIGWLSRAYGLTCDSLIGARIVLLNGSICNVSKLDHGVFVYPIEDAHKIMKTYFSITNPLNNPHPLPDNITLYLFLLPTQVLVMSLYHEGDITQNIDTEERFEFYKNRVIEKLFAFNPIYTSFTDSYTCLQSMFDIGNKHGKHYYWKSLFFNTAISEETQEALLKAIKKAPEASTIEVMHLGGAISKVAHTHTAYYQRDALYEIHSICSWENNSLDISIFRNWAQQEFFDNVSKYSCNINGYINTAQQTKNTEGFYGENYARLVQLKNKYDPQNLLHRNHNIRPSFIVSDDVER
ncbi:hypothetical protein FDP41_010432 [Naegleria fowleri]|uniref:FAD-binding PCMH-type domain-containing protein n=1 Tax=Naegleria fowleri TaxID=5763 RepID=A0A6A5C1U2_NAEFO|nr:uncharacterized protein FDP41_010432 [Naegleria fowleri]KAF0983367.1 hypothetical protein FDP41_010432 [Naegleria fowleri]